MVRTSGLGTGDGSKRTTSTGGRVAEESNSKMRVVSCAPTEKKCGSAGSAGTAVTWTSVADAAEADGEGDRDGLAGIVEKDGAGDSAGDAESDTEAVGVRAAGKHALAITVSATAIVKEPTSRRMVRL